MNSVQSDRPSGTTSLKPANETLEVSPAAFSGNEWLSYDPGSVWILQGAEVVIERASAVDRLIVRKLSTNECVEVHRAELAPAPVKKLSAESRQLVEEVDTPDVEEAKHKEAALAPYVDGAPLTTAQRADLAAQFKVDVSTIKRWLKAYREVRHWSAFLKKKSGPSLGSSKLDSAVEAIITAAIDEQAQADQDFTAETIIATIQQRCSAACLSTPSLKAVRVRVNIHRQDLKHLPADVRAEHKQQHRLIRGKLVVDAPLNFVQVDHTPVDLPVVCPIRGQVIGCPYITIVFDVKTRVVLGFCLTLEAPSQLSTALALHHAVFPKEEWLARIGANGPWPFYGIMRVLHTDGAAEFVTPHFNRAAKRWNIEWRRRKGGPQVGGHIERLLGTLMKRIHGQKGASRFRGKRRRNPPKGHHTLASLHTWVANEITAYHYDDKHRALGMAPAQAWGQSWMSPDGLVLPVFPRDEREFLISFLPGASRVVTREGIAWKGLEYRCPELEPFICPAKRQFFRFDKRDISRIFFDTGEGPFLEVPWTQWNFPKLSVWEWDEIRPTLRVAARETDVRIVHEVREANRELNRKLQATTQRARRRLAREADWQQSLPPPDPNQKVPLTATVTSTNSPLVFEILE